MKICSNGVVAAIICFVLFVFQKGIAQEHTKRVRYIRSLIIADSDSAQRIINKNIIAAVADQNCPAHIDNAILKIELNWFIKDFSRMKIELFNTIHKLGSKASPSQKLFISYFQIVNDEVNKNNEHVLRDLSDLKQRALKFKLYNLLAKCEQLAGNHYVGIKRYGEARKHYYSSIAYFRKNLDFNDAQNIKSKIAASYVYEQKYQEAEKLFLELTRYCIKNKFSSYLATIYSNLGSAYLGQEKYKQAKYYYQLSLRIPSIKMYAKLNSFHGLGDLYHELNQHDSSYLCMHEILVENEKMKSKSDLALANEIEKSFERELQANIIQQKDTQIKNAKNKTHIILVFVFIGLLLLSIIFAVIFYTFRIKTSLNKMLVVQKEKILIKNKLIETSLNEKVILLKEIHHRVKNNLQIISSLLNLQSRTVVDQEALSVLTEGMERIQAIALIHQKLYQMDSFATIDMQGYTEDLCKQLTRTYVSDSQTVRIDIRASDIQLNLDTAIPIGLIICELVTNAFKHGFRNMSNGHLTIQIEQEGISENYKLIVSDNGRGYVNDQLVHSGLGTEIVEALIEQLEGRMLVDSTENGTCIQLFF